MDPIDAISEMRSRHEKGELWVGLDPFAGEVADMAKLDVYEPMQVKAQMVKSATEAATMLIKIDDVIAAAKMKPPKKGEEMGGEEEAL